MTRTPEEPNIDNGALSSSHLSHYIDAVGEASKRNRLIAIILITASILCFIAAWNGTQWSWNTNRVNLYEDALIFWPLLKTKEGLVGLKARDSEAYQRYLEAQEYLGKMGYKPQQLANAKFLSGEIVEYQENFRQLIEMKYLELYESRIENVLNIRLPFFGIFFDINDLGVFSGIAFLAILFMFRYSLLREYRNLLYFTNNDTIGDDLHPYRMLMATKQVLTIPPQNDGESKFWRDIPRLVLLAPVVIILLVLLNDFLTFHIGSDVSIGRTKLSFALTAILGVLVTFLAFSCNKAWASIDEEWHRLFDGAGGKDARCDSGETSNTDETVREPTVQEE